MKAIIVLAAVVPWLLGFYAVFFVSAQYTGRGLFESYLAFQGGSHLGNVIWFSVWTGMTSGPGKCFEFPPSGPLNSLRPGKWLEVL
ncbi:hypothetical protein [Arthrobacter bambusae]|uniref:hypothetical protein n=1 Tax=Arthrobacter bambusae TaxID=1338426 RepID=UPI002782CE53|nr:hypothetical protein [Arthrobacter bambusae]MDQ0031455.1 hypothetical protein [Arthrobacter bambusae]MDQ0099657.1 hypothetical protein [Arthrobacter bambusae]